MNRFVRIRAWSVGVRELYKAAFSDHGDSARASSDAAAAAACRQVMLADVVGDSAVQHSQINSYCLSLLLLFVTAGYFVT